MWRLIWNVGGLALVIGVVALVALTVFSSRELRLHAALEAQGVDVMARVIETERKVVRSSDGGSKTEYYGRFSYELRREGTLTVRRKISRSLYNRLEQGQEVPARVVPGRAGRIELTRGEFRQAGRMLQWAALAVGLAMLAWLWFGGRKVVSALLARRVGRSVQVTVKEVRRFKSKNTSKYALVWSDEQGREGMSLRSGVDRFANYAPGDPVEVFVCPDGRVWWVGDVGPRQPARTVPDVEGR